MSAGLGAQIRIIRSAPKYAHPNYQRGIEEAAALQVLEQSRDWFISFGSVTCMVLYDLRVTIPGLARRVKLDEPDALLHHLAGHQTPLAE